MDMLKYLNWVQQWGIEQTTLSWVGHKLWEYEWNVNINTGHYVGS